MRGVVLPEALCLADEARHGQQDCANTEVPRRTPAGGWDATGFVIAVGEIVIDGNNPSRAELTPLLIFIIRFLNSGYACALVTRIDVKLTPRLNSFQQFFLYDFCPSQRKIRLKQKGVMRNHRSRLHA
jgi:hypothetical protein